MMDKIIEIYIIQSIMLWRKFMGKRTLMRTFKSCFSGGLNSTEVLKALIDVYIREKQMQEISLLGGNMNGLYMKEEIKEDAKGEKKEAAKAEKKALRQ